MALYGRSDTKNTIEPSFTPNFLNLELKTIGKRTYSSSKRKTDDSQNISCVFFTLLARQLLGKAFILRIPNFWKHYTICFNLLIYLGSSE